MCDFHSLVLNFLNFFPSFCFLNSNSYLDLEMIDFTLHEVLVASISQVMMKSNGKGIRIVNDTEEEVMTETLYGDSVRLQQVLADFLLISVNFTPNGGQLVVVASLTKDQLGQSVHLAHLELRYCFLSKICIHTDSWRCPKSTLKKKKRRMCLHTKLSASCSPFFLLIHQ